MENVSEENDRRTRFGGVEASRGDSRVVDMRERMVENEDGNFDRSTRAREIDFKTMNDDKRNVSPCFAYAQLCHCGADHVRKIIIRRGRQ